MKNNKIVLSSLVFVLALAAPCARAFAQQGPCKADAEKFCKDSKGTDRMACLKTHEADLSDACKAKMAGHKGKGMESHPCAPDAEKFCKDSKGMDRMACLKTHEADLSDACKAKMAGHKEGRGDKQPNVEVTAPQAAPATQTPPAAAPGTSPVTAPEAAPAAATLTN